MSQEESQGQGVEINFLEKEHELTKLAKKLGTSAKKAIEYLEGILADDKADPARKQAAAEKIIQFYLQCNKQINDDSLARLIAQAKLGNGRGRAVALEPGDKPQKPRLDFDTVREV